jgi:hypothetical protein
MMAASEIFKLEVPPYESKTSKSAGGSFTLTSPSEKTCKAISKRNMNYSNFRSVPRGPFAEYNQEKYQVK